MSFPNGNPLVDSMKIFALSTKRKRNNKFSFKMNRVVICDEDHNWHIAWY